jgi:hypothetical protein
MYNTEFCFVYFIQIEVCLRTVFLVISNAVFVIPNRRHLKLNGSTSIPDDFGYDLFSPMIRQNSLRRWLTSPELASMMLLPGMQLAYTWILVLRAK